MLAGPAVERGLVGPREVSRLWERHILNCAVVTELIPPGASVVDVGSGAGLPGIVMALTRSDLRVTLLEPLLRRTTFLEESVEALRLGDRVTVIRGRAEEVAGTVSGEVVTARAVAPLEKLAWWCLPLVTPGGQLLAIKGSSAAEEVASSKAAIRRLGGGPAEVLRVGAEVSESPATVVRIRVVGPPHRRRKR
ncbi:MAG: 16S rRNA (guanine(527)-N(7))-methyltransferase RsmG [Actinomycetes bacterium]